MVEQPYWLSGFEEACAGCEHLISHAVEIRCFDCDEPFCPVCVVTIDTRHYCSDCEPHTESE